MPVSMREYMEIETDRILEIQLLKIIKERFYEKKVEVCLPEKKDWDEHIRYRVTYYPTLPTISKEFIINKIDAQMEKEAVD